MDTHNVRLPAVSGSFYPSDSNKLDHMISDLIGGVKIEQEFDRIIGLIVPHAGYIYSGKTAAYSYSVIRKNDRRKFIIVGPNHRSFPPYAAISTSGFWETPLGRAKIDENLANLLVSHSRALVKDSMAQREEHSVEVQIPFLQHLFGDNFSFVPIILGDQDEDTAIELSREIEPFADDATIIASSDLTHYDPLETAQSKDARLINDIISLNTERFYETLRSFRITACGYGAIAILMEVTKRLGGKIKLLNYSTSFDYSRDSSFVVGYSSLVSYID